VKRFQLEKSQAVVVDQFDELTARLLDVVEFMRDNYCHIMDDAERNWVLTALAYASKHLPEPPAPIVD
jgi:hypothetical protein